MNGISSSNAIHDQDTRADLGEAREKEHVWERGPGVKNDHSKPALEERRKTSVNCSDQAAVSSEDLHPLSIFFSGRPGFLQLDAVPLRTAFIRPEAEVQAGNQENPVQRRCSPRVIPGKLFCFRRKHMERVGSPRPGVVPFRQHSCVDLDKIFRSCYVI